jgi:hypothetical protein
MFAYLAFKGLLWRKEYKSPYTLYSPVLYTAWNRTVTTWGEFFYLRTAVSELDRGLGIFGGTLEEAKRYALQVYLVSPDPDHRLVLGSLGWRAEAAMVIAPVITKESAAKQILAAYRAGYPQVPGVLAWAARYASPEEGVPILQNILNSPQDERVLQIIADSAAVIGEDGVPILDRLIRGEYQKISPRS